MASRRNRYDEAGDARFRRGSGLHARRVALPSEKRSERRQLGAGQHGQGPAVQRGGVVGEHARDHGRRAVRAHALRQALLGRAAHGGGLGGRRRGARGRAARAPPARG